MSMSPAIIENMPLMTFMFGFVFWMGMCFGIRLMDTTFTFLDCGQCGHSWFKHFRKSCSFILTGNPPNDVTQMALCQCNHWSWRR